MLLPACSALKEKYRVQLQSQFDALEKPVNAIVVKIDQGVESIAEEIIGRLQRAAGQQPGVSSTVRV